MHSIMLKNSIDIFELENFIEESCVEVKLKNIPDFFEIHAISDGRSPLAHSICFLEKVEQVQLDSSVVFILSEEIANQPCIVTSDPRYLFIKFLEYIQRSYNYVSLPDGVVKGKHITAFVHEKAIIEEDVFIDQDAWIGAGAVIKKGTVIGKGSIIRENTVIGCSGIALYKSNHGEVVRFPHLSGVIIGENVEIGANAVIVQGTLKPTVVEDNVVIGNLCNIGHGVIVKEKVWMSVGTLIGGNCLVEQGSTLGLGVSVKDNLSILENTSIGMGSVVTKSTEKNASYFGVPAERLRGLKTGPVR